MKKIVIAALAIVAAVCSLAGLTWLFYPRPELMPPPAPEINSKSPVECFKGREVLRRNKR